MSTPVALPSSIRGISAGLHWVRKELDQNLELASQLVQQHAEAPQGATALHKAIAHLQEVRGAAVLIQAYGVALLAEEMKQTAQDLASGRVHEPEPALAAVVSACLQAGDYLDLLQQGQQDSALILQPIVNELRLSRGKSLLTEDDLFVAQFRVLGLHLERHAPVRADANLQAEAQRLSPVFSAALLSWFKEQDSAQALSRIGRISEVLADHARERPLYQLWRTAAACVEALLSRTLDETLELKRQFGRAGQLLKIVGESGETMALRQMSDVSLRLLFYAGRSSGAGPRVAELRRGLQLEIWLPPVETVQACRARLRGANTGLLVRVAEELRADLVEVRDSIDIALRSGAGAGELDATVQRLKRVADTLLVLGLSAESQALAEPVETLHEAGDSGVEQTAAWMEFATAVLQVELSLEGALYRQLQAVPGAPDPAGKLAPVDLREGTAALYRESLVNLARVKGYIEAYIKNDDVFGLPEAARLLDEVAAGFRVLAQDQAEEQVLRVQQFLQSPDFSQVRSDPAVAGRFADAIAAIEYYLEFRRDNSPAAADVLGQLAALADRLASAPAAGAGMTADMAEESVAAAIEPPPEFAVERLDGLDTLPDAVPETVPAAPQAGLGAMEAVFAEPEDDELRLVEYVPPPAASAAEVAPAFEPEAPAFQLLGEPLPEPAPPAEAPLRPAVAVAPSLPPSAAEPEVDPEIRDVFLAEADEVLQTLTHELPGWLRQPEERERLSTIRRAFHTLKGSGRMVGAQDIGEFSWALESLLNRCLDRTVDVSSPVMGAVREAVALLPEMIAAFRDRQPPPEAAAALAERARQLASGTALGEGGDMIAVFRSDAQQRLQMVARWIRDQDGLAGETSIPEPVVRAFHTLRGAALAVGARPVGELAGSLETYLDPLHRGRLPLSPAGMALVGEATAALEQWVARAGEAGGSGADATPWLARVEALRQGEPAAAAAQDDEDAQLAEIFSFEALDLVQKFETDLDAWSRAPDATHHATALKASVHTLKGAAGMAHCAPIAATAQALNLRLATMSGGPAPSSAFFDGLRDIVEGLYGQIDAYRDGSLDGDGSELVARVTNLDSSPGEVGLSPLPVATPVPASVPPAPVPAVSDVAAVREPEAHEPDEELREIFLQEAEELVSELEASADGVADAPRDVERTGPWLRALHTLKGSARTAGVPAMGELVHRLETAAERVTAFTGDATLFRRQVRFGTEGLRDLLDAVKRREGFDEHGLLARFDALVPDAAPVVVEPMPPADDEPFPVPEAEVEVIDLGAADGDFPWIAEVTQPVAEMPAPLAPSSPEVSDAAGFDGTDEALPELEPLDLAPDTAVSVPAGFGDVSEAPGSAADSRPVQPDATDPPAVGLPAEVDRELFAIFAPEAEELLDALQRALAAWRNLPGDAEPGRWMQRDLHTFKGGARMAGLGALGDAAHALETRLADLEHEGRLLEPASVDAIGSALDRLHHEYDDVVRVLGLPALPVDELPSAEPAVEHPQVLEAAELPELRAEEPAEPAPADTPVFEAPPAATVPVATVPVAMADVEPDLAPLEVLTAWDPQLFWRPGGDEAAATEVRREAVRVPVERLDAMLNQAGEISIFRSRLEEKNTTLVGSLGEMAQTITRVREQLRLLDIETEAQIAARGFARGVDDEADGHRYDAQFDPLEMDRYSRMQELSRSLAEAVADMSSLYASLDTSVSESEVLLQQQGRINNEVQQGLMGTLMVPFSRQVQRLARVVRQTAEQNGKLARAEFQGADSELDRNVLERMTAPLEHLLRNCVVHGIEAADARRAAGKADEGVVTVALKREGAQLAIEVRDDGRGLDFAAIRAQAVRRGLMRADAQVSDEDLARFVFAAGFSTAQTLTQDAGRGIGMDVVASEVKQLGGTVDIVSEAGRGVRFRIRLPLMLAVSQALVVQVGEELFAIPIAAVEGIVRVPRESLPDMLKEGGEALGYGDRQYQLRRLGDLVGLPAPARIDARSVPAILMRMGDGLDASGRRVAVVADRLLGNREIVTKPAGPILGSVSGVSGATILADGRVMLIVDVPALIQESTRRRLGNETAVLPVVAEDVRRLIMVVDDSITIRRVTERLLVRKGYRVITAKDGLDAMAMLQTETPDAMLLDIEMPRADGFEVAAFVRNTARIRQLPIVMITSRSGDKHREHARSLGVNRYLIKPYQEDQLIDELRALLAAQPATA